VLLPSSGPVLRRETLELSRHQGQREI